MIEWLWCQLTFPALLLSTRNVRKLGLVSREGCSIIHRILIREFCRRSCFHGMVSFGYKLLQTEHTCILVTVVNWGAGGKKSCVYAVPSQSISVKSS